MRKRQFIIIFFLLGTLSLCTACAGSSSSTSLYNSSTARHVSHHFFFNFGPKSSHFRYDKRMIRAAKIASERARAHSHRRCWHYVKSALVKAKVVSHRPTTEYAKQAAKELTKSFGFKKLPITNPFNAPIGSVLVYGGHGAGHVEIRTAKGFVSDFRSAKPSRRPLIGVYIKPVPKG